MSGVATSDRLVSTNWTAFSDFQDSKDVFRREIPTPYYTFRNDCSQELIDAVNSGVYPIETRDIVEDWNGKIRPDSTQYIIQLWAFDPNRNQEYVRQLAEVAGVKL